ncbi:MAG TPA: protein kinase, partial [Polyangiaceae bacterium]
NAVRRFLREVRACGTLHHPHVVRVLEAGGDESEEYPLYTVFEYVPGQTLAARLSIEGTLRVSEAVGLMSQVLDALQAAHELGVVHRDLKPANIMVSETASGFHAKILDFGIAGLLEGSSGQFDAGLTQTHERLGTPAYCAPEQLRGEPPSARVDVYAWGLVFLQCLTGRLAFGGGTLPEVLEAQFSKEPIPLPDSLAQHRLGALLRSALEKDAARRAINTRLLLGELQSLDLTAIVDRSGFLLGTVEAPGAEISPPTHISPLARARGERRPVTAVCCRINVTTLQSHADDDALDEWLDDVRVSMIEIAQRHGGALAGSAGAELLFYFGLAAGEDGATRRATAAACEIRELCQRRSNAMRVRAAWDVDFRLALHQGMVSVDPQSQRERAGIGSVAAAVSQLCQLVERGGIAVSHVAYGRVREGVSLEVGGSSASGRWYYVSTEPETSPRELARKAPVSTVGQDDERARLLEIWASDSAATRGALLMGGAGLGKTHVARAFLASLDAEQVRVLEARCLPETQDLSMQPVLNMLRDRLGLTGKSPAAGSEALLAFLQGQHFEDTAEAMPLLCAWFGLPNQGWPEPEYSPKKRRDLFLALMVRLVQSLSDLPTVLFIEDVHWADPTTLEWLAILTKSSAHQRPFLLGTLRGEALAPTSGEARPRTEALARLAKDLSTIEMQALDESSARRLLLSAWGEPAPSEAELAGIVSRGGGVPLFLLELARCRAEGAAIPASIADLLSARIDRLGNDVKETVQLAAVIGAEFDAELLREVSTRGANLPGDLNYLQQSGLLASGSEGQYAFSHSLLHESAYKSMLVGERQRLHARTADALLRIRPEYRDSKPWTL